MPKINKGYRRNNLNASLRTRRRIIQLQDQDIQFMKINSYQPDNLNNLLISSNKTPVPVPITNCVNDTIYNNNLSPQINFNINNNLTINEPQFLPVQTNKTIENNCLNSKNDIETFKIEIKNWAVNCRIPQCHLNALLIILRKYDGFKMLPKDSRTLLQTPNKVTIDKIRLINPNGKYFHFGLTESLLKYYSSINNIPNIVELVIGIDGLPIARCSNSQLWPILAYVKPENSFEKKHVFPVGLFWGKSKPIDSNEFLYDFVNETKGLLSNGLKINDQIIPVTIFSFCCDAPAKSFLTKTKGHTGLSSCSRCTQEGEYLCNRTSFPYKNVMSPKRTHASFVAKSHDDYHVSNVNTILLDLPNFNIVERFSLDYMHLTCLGVMRKLIFLWMNGPLSVRLPNSKIKQISANLRLVKNYIPIEFCRKPRDVEEACRWKATEFRQLLIYTGPIILKNILSKKCYTNFMCLHIAMVILISPNLKKYIEFAQLLLNSFVKYFQDIYGKHLISHNIHGLLHLCEDYKLFGPLDNVSCFPFENFMKNFKSMLRKHEKPLEQIVKRYKEIEINTFLNIPTKNNSQDIILKRQHFNGPLPTTLQGSQYKTLVLSLKLITIKIDNVSDCFFGTINNEIVKVENIVKNLNTEQITVVGRKFTKKEPLYQKPIKSNKFGTYVVKELSDDYILYNIDDIIKKYIVFCSYKEDNNNIAMPVLHNVT
uniref:DUF4218 domain-containing protein n=1 Tax=Schizaphis graminum TaxID=13262 RepID=A0A2S2PL84_SCHGA